MNLSQKNISQKGFTLIEMLTVLAIFAVLTSIVVFNYSKFTSQTILTNMAYEIALSIRESQIYGVSVRNPDGSLYSGDFSHQYGVHFDKNQASYFVFSDVINDDGKATGSACGSAGSECVKPYKLQRAIVVSDLQIDCKGSLNKLDISFKRPNPEARFNDDVDKGLAYVEIKAPDGEKRYVVTRSNGQIFVTGEKPAC